MNLRKILLIVLMVFFVFPGLTMAQKGKPKLPGKIFSVELAGCEGDQNRIKIVLSVGRVNDVDFFQLYRKDDPGPFDNIVAKKILPFPDQRGHITVIDLAPNNTKCMYKFRAVNDIGVSGWSNAKKIYTKDCKKSNFPPVPICDVSPRKGLVPLTFFFDGSKSYDPDGIIKKYKWDFGNGDKSSLIKGFYTYKKEGLYTVTHTVEDNEGESAECKVKVDAYLEPPPNGCDANPTIFVSFEPSIDPESGKLKFRPIVEIETDKILENQNGFWRLYRSSYKPGSTYSKAMVPVKEFHEKGTRYIYDNGPLLKNTTVFFLLERVCGECKQWKKFGPALLVIPSAKEYQQ